MKSKKCCRCKKIKSITEFHSDKSRGDGLNAKCKLCVKEVGKKYEDVNRDKIRKRKQKYYQSNKEHILKRNRLYNKLNKSKNAERRRIKRKNNILIRLRDNVSRQISHMIKAENGTKHFSILKYLPYTIQELKNHLEKQFEPWMTWENYGRYTINNKKVWHVDHIVPQSLLPYNSMEHENFIKCWALENLRPLRADQNISKGNKV